MVKKVFFLSLIIFLKNSSIPMKNHQIAGGRLYVFYMDVATYNAFILHKLKFQKCYKNKINLERALELETPFYELQY